MTGLTLCPTCGASAAPDARFCPTCGATLLDGGADALLMHVQRALVHEFDVTCEIGRGGMAAVYLALDLRLPRKVALKVMLPELAYSETMPQRFLGEARTAAMLDHPNIVPIYRAGESGGIRFFAMRYIDGCSLEQLLRVERRLPIALSCYILAETARALDFAHGEGVIHRDVKPGNVMLDRRWGRAIVTDFGIAKLADAENLTRTGFAIGTPAYMSPELCRGSAPSSASDQYALGVVAYQLLTGSPPFVGSQLDVQMAQLRDTPRPIRDVYPECPVELEATVLRMLEKAPEGRWPCLGDVLSVLLRHVGGSEAAQQEELRRRLATIAPVRGGSATPSSPMPSHIFTPFPPSVRVVVDPPSSPSLPPAPPPSPWAPAAAGGWLAADAPGSTNGGNGVPTGTPRADVASGPLPALRPAASGVDAVHALTITPSEAAAAVGATVRFEAQGTDANGRPIPGLLVTWATDDAEVAALSGPGVATALATGATRVVARAGTCEAVAMLQVQAAPAVVVPAPAAAPAASPLGAPVAALQLLPRRVQLRPGGVARLRALALDADGAVLEGQPLAWQVTDPRVASVDPSGEVRALASGRAEIVVTLGMLSASAELVIATAITETPLPGLPGAPELEHFGPPPSTTAVWPRGVPLGAASTAAPGRTADAPVAPVAPPADDGPPPDTDVGQVGVDATPPAPVEAAAAPAEFAAPTPWPEPPAVPDAPSVRTPLTLVVDGEADAGARRADDDADEPGEPTFATPAAAREPSTPRNPELRVVRDDAVPDGDTDSADPHAEADDDAAPLAAAPVDAAAPRARARKLEVTSEHAYRPGQFAAEVYAEDGLEDPPPAPRPARRRGALLAVGGLVGVAALAAVLLSQRDGTATNVRGTVAGVGTDSGEVVQGPTPPVATTGPTGVAGDTATPIDTAPVVAPSDSVPTTREPSYVLAIRPRSVLMREGTPTQLRAVFDDTAASRPDSAVRRRDVRWSSADTARVAVSAEGVVQARRSGSPVRVTAQVGDRRASILVTVTPAPDAGPRPDTARPVEPVRPSARALQQDNAIDLVAPFLAALGRREVGAVQQYLARAENLDRARIDRWLPERDGWRVGRAEYGEVEPDGENRMAVNFNVPMSWKKAFTRESRSTQFRAHYEWRGGRWELTGVTTRSSFPP